MTVCGDIQIDVNSAWGVGIDLGVQSYLCHFSAKM